MVQDLYAWIQQNETGRSVYNEFLNTNQEAFPLYIQEAAGIAKGSSMEFEQILIMVWTACCGTNAKT